MRLLITNAFLRQRTGSELAAVEIAEVFRLRGHEVALQAPLLGPLAERLLSVGFPVVDSPEKSPWRPDLIHGQHWEPTTIAALAFPNTPVVNVIHGALPAEEEPCLAPNIVRYVAVDVPCQRRIQSATGLAAKEIPIIPNGVRLDLFPQRRDFTRSGKALVFSNYAHENERLAEIRSACQAAGLALDVVGLVSGQATEHPGEVLVQYDLVFAKARCAVEAMACGCRVILSDECGLGPVVTPENFAALYPWNFGYMLLTGPHAQPLLRQRIDEALNVDSQKLSDLCRAVADFSHSAALWEQCHQSASMLPVAIGADNSAAFAKSLLNRWKKSLAILRANSELQKERRRSEFLGRCLAHSLDEIRLRREKNWLHRRLLRGLGEKTVDSLRRKRSLFMGPEAWMEKLSTTLSKLESADPKSTPGAKPIVSTSPILKVPEESHPPLTFIVGFPRSGTTWLRLLLDAHPLLAIPPETGFLPAAAALNGTGPALQEKLVKLIVSWPEGCSHFIDYGITEEELREAFLKVNPFCLSGALRAFYGLIASKQNKPRAGDKTPIYAKHLPLLHELLPECRVVHLIRDGRDCVASLREQRFAAKQDAAELARDWAQATQCAQADGAKLPHYLEVRYENLVLNHEAELHRICDFLDLPWEPATLRHSETAAARLAGLQTIISREGEVVAWREERLARHQLATQGAIASRIGQWKKKLSAEDTTAIHAIAGHLLHELGYEV